MVSPPLNGDNYGSWLRAITMALRAKNKVGFVDGSIEKPGEDKEKEVSRWERCNDLVASWILNCVSDEIRSSILYAHTARAIWIDLSDQFLQSNAPQIYQLKRSISALKQEELSISAYFTKLKSLWDELNSLQAFQPCGGNCPHPSSGSRPYSGDGNSFYSGGGNRSNPSDGNCTYTAGGCNSSGGGYNSYSGGGNNSNHKVKYHCDHCDKDGPSTERCYKIIGYPPKRSEFSNLSTKFVNKTSPVVVTQEQYDKSLAMLSSGNIHHNSNLAGIALSIPPTSIWIIDTGATNHMCSSTV
ncbi:hypothetical protein RHSIM_Rhsim01G0035500 [Rhododendron simsii]|uniref:Retrotransposon Copia-like N-terminal domain-containing protein n=1 Tax=Rhododendron simsii TaxID=118357 RepID=A0A834HJ92_RHOSS|nr:hypothetical protein RHSIM_Rhsim01G0035500 [Rhododendron simsii]